MIALMTLAFTTMACLLLAKVRSTSVCPSSPSTSTCVSSPSSAAASMSDTAAPSTKGGNRPSINATSFYDNYEGHPVDDLRELLSGETDGKPSIYLAGDSTLDNKFWIPTHAEQHPDQRLNARLSHPSVRRDVAYWLAHFASGKYHVVNTAVEASLLRTRVRANLLPQDELVRDALTEDDVLVVSAGGNDIALSPKIATAWAVLRNVYLGGEAGMPTLRALFRDDLELYIAMLTKRTKPRVVIVCMLYFPDEEDAPSWASHTLRALRYNGRPSRMQEAMKRVYATAVTQIAVADCRIMFVPFFQTLDGKQSSDYVERVEPSESGGSRMAKQLFDAVEAQS